MKKNLLYLLLIALSVISYSCKNKSSQSISKVNGFETYINAYTSGIVSSRESIRLRFTKEISDFKEGDVISRDIISFEPKIKGKIYCVNAKEIEFIPNDKLENGKDYMVKINLYKLFDVPKEFKQFKFNFSTIKQALVYKEEGLKLKSDGFHLLYKANILTADFIEGSDVEKIVKIDGDYKINWQHSIDGRSHSIVIDSIRKLDYEQEIKISWDGAICKIDSKGTSDIRVPAKGDFFVTSVLPELKYNKKFKIVFSDVVDPNQDLRGLISLENYSNLKFNISLSEITVYSDSQLSGARKLTISEGIKCITGDVLKKSKTAIVAFEEIKPLARFIGKGTIIPSEEGFVIPFSAVNLSAVDIRVIQIYQNNIHQFLQNNKINETDNLRKVGRLVLEKKVDLQDGVRNLKKWNDFRVDLSDLMEVDRSAIYRIEIRFKKKYSLYGVNKDNKKDEKDYEYEKEQDWDSSGWYSSSYYPEGYRWSDKDNPSTISYFSSRHFVAKNIFASNLGVIAKRGADKNMFVYVSKLTTTEAVSEASVLAYSYQNQLFTSAKTNNDGFAKLKLNNKPFLIVVKKDNETAYLRVDDGSSLSISNFDVAGAHIQKGLKGFIYGERGVWRPGDKIHISFILEDKQMTLPEHHPIIAKLYNARGQFVKKIVQHTSEKGINCFVFDTKEDAPTGNWRVDIQVGGARFTKRLKVETIKPNRLKINMSVPNDFIKTSANTKLKIETAWLHGAKAPNLKADVKMNLKKKRTSFEGFSNYRFDDNSKEFWFSERQIFDGKTNEAGVLNINIPKSNLKNAPGLLRASFLTRVFEKSGDFSISGKSFTFSPYSTYVGMRLPSDDDWYKTNKDYKLDIASVDESGKKVSRDLTVELFKVKWSWWWDSDNSNLASYVNRRYNKNVTTYNVKSVNGKASVNIKAKNYGRYFLRVTDKKSGHSCGKAIYFSSWGGFDASDLPGGASLLALTLDKKSYNVGDEVIINIPSSKSGKALVSIESGISVIDQFIIETKDKKTKFSFKATEKMSPNIYVNVSLIQKHKNTDNDHPMRLYGIIPVKVNNPSTVLVPLIQQDKELRPEKMFSLEISEKNGKEMSYTVAIVDEGLLDITSYRTPKPHAAFYAREALGVKTWDMYDYVIGAYGARLENAFAIGGDAEARGRDKKRTNRFKPVVIFKGPFTVKKGESKKHTFEMPNYIGAVRTMVVAANKGAYGSSQVRSEVKKPLMLLATLPRILNPGDKIKLPVTLFAMDKKIKDVDLKIKLSDELKLIGSKQQTIHFTETGEKIAEFEIQVLSKVGRASVEIVAEGSGERATYETGIEIRVPNPPITKISEELVQENKEISIDISSIGIDGTNKATLEVSSLPAMNLAKRTEYLIGYPHGCLEQTVSSALPQLYLSDMTNITSNQEKDCMDNVNAAISKLMRFQTVDGGFTYWPGGRYISEWANIYAGHFMVLAGKKGYTIPVSMKKKWLHYQQTMSNNWNDYSKYYNSELLQAYRLYVLALAGKENVGAMNRMRERTKLPHVASWRLASAYAITGRANVAERIINNLSTDVKSYREWGNTFGTATRDKGMILETLILMNKKKDAFKIATYIARKLGEDSWMSTQTVAYSLYVMSQYVEKYHNDKSSILCDYSINGKSKSVSSSKSIYSQNINIESLKKASVKLKNNGKNPLFVRLINKGIPLKYEESDNTSKLKMSVVYRDSDGRNINPSLLKQGTDIIAVITVSNNSYASVYEQLALTAMFPTGWEIANSRLFDAKDNNDVDYMDMRDDRVLFYFSLMYNKTKTFKVNLNASYKGEYYLPAISCEAMYDNEVRAVVAGSSVVVK